MPDNERLEFLGDGIISAIAADFLYSRFPNEPEGILSKKKAFLVSRRELGRRAEQMGLGELVLLGKGEEHSGGRARISVIGSALEALVGALYFEIPYPALRQFVTDSILVPLAIGLNEEIYLDYKSRFQELVQKTTNTIPRYAKVSEEGPSHEKTFTVEVYVGEECMGAGQGKRIKTAENRAAKMAHEKMMRQGCDK
jgi:ribonuclease III